MGVYDMASSEQMLFTSSYRNKSDRQEGSKILPVDSVGFFLVVVVVVVVLFYVFIYLWLCWVFVASPASLQLQ